MGSNKHKNNYFARYFAYTVLLRLQENTAKEGIITLNLQIRRVMSERMSHLPKRIQHLGNSNPNFLLPKLARFPVSCSRSHLHKNRSNIWSKSFLVGLEAMFDSWEYALSIQMLLLLLFMFLVLFLSLSPFYFILLLATLHPSLDLLPSPHTLVLSSESFLEFLSFYRLVQTKL